MNKIVLSMAMLLAASTSIAGHLCTLVTVKNDKLVSKKQVSVFENGLTTGSPLVEIMDEINSQDEKVSVGFYGVIFSGGDHLLEGNFMRSSYKRYEYNKLESLSEKVSLSGDTRATVAYEDYVTDISCAALPDQDLY